MQLGKISVCVGLTSGSRTPLAKPTLIKPEEQIARSYVDRLILEQISEMDSVMKLGELADKLASRGVGLAAIKSLLASNPERFAYHERRWIPAARLSAAGRPLMQAMDELLDTFGGPMPYDMLLNELSRLRHEDVELIEPVLQRILEKDNEFIVTNDGHVSLVRWSFVADDEPYARALALNRVDADTVEEVRAKVAGIDFRAPGAIAEAIKKVAPVSLKVLGAVVWSSVNSQDATSVLVFDARQFYRDALSVPGYVFSPDGAIHPEADVAKWVSAAVRLADKLAPTIDVEDAAPIEMKAADIEKLAKRVAAMGTSYTATKLLEEQYEVTPSNKTFPDDMANIMAALKAQPELQWLGGDRFAAAGTAPDYIQSVPEPFLFTDSENLNEEGDLIDVELTDDGLSTTLRKLLAHPLATDVLDEDVQPAPKTMPDTLRLVLKSIHRELGTFPLCQIPTGWLDSEPDIQELVVIDGAGRELQVWINLRDRLMYNWLEWWFEQPIESGAVFTLTKTNKPNVVEFEWLDQPDPVVYISTQRMEELRQIGADAEGKSTLELLIEVMNHWPKGADYLTVLAEVNVVRRSSRRLIASLLSSYHCFYQRSGSPVWHFDPKKVDQGFDKSKKKFVKK